MGCVARLETPRYRWVVLFSLFYTFVAYAFVFQEAPPLIDSIMQEFNIARGAEAGLLMSAVVVPGVFLSLPAGLIVDRYGVRSIGFISTVLTAIGSLVTATANSFTTMLLGRFIVGMGGAFITTALPTIIPQWFSREELGKAMGFYGTNMPVATVTAFSTASLLMLNYGWRYPFYVGTVVAATATAVFTSFVREGPFRPAKSNHRVNVRQALANVELWKVGLIWLLFQVTTISFLSWAPKLFQNYKGLDPVYASLSASALMFAAIPCVPVCGWISDRFGGRKPFLFIGSFLMALALIASAYAFGSALLISVAILGIAASMVPPVVSALPAEILEPRLIGTGFGILAVCLNIGVSLAAPLMGFLVDVTGSLVLSFAGAGMFSVLGAIVAYTLKTR